MEGFQVSLCLEDEAAGHRGPRSAQGPGERPPAGSLTLRPRGGGSSNSGRNPLDTGGGDGRDEVDLEASPNTDVLPGPEGRGGNRVWCGQEVLACAHSPTRKYFSNAVLVCRGSHSRVPAARQLRQGRQALSRFWRLEPQGRRGQGRFLPRPLSWCPRPSSPVSPRGRHSVCVCVWISCSYEAPVRPV